MFKLILSVKMQEVFCRKHHFSEFQPKSVAIDSQGIKMVYMQLRSFDL